MRCILLRCRGLQLDAAIALKRSIILIVRVSNHNIAAAVHRCRQPAVLHARIANQTICIHRRIKKHACTQLRCKARAIALRHVDISRTQIDAGGSIERAAYVDSALRAQLPSLLLQRFTGSLRILKFVFCSQHRQRTCVNHAVRAHNHAVLAQKVQVAADLVITDGVYRTININPARHRIDQGIQGSAVLRLLKIQICQLLIPHLELLKTVQAYVAMHRLCINICSAGLHKILVAIHTHNAAGSERFTTKKWQHNKTCCQH